MALLSAGGGNSEGAGNLGITNFTGTSTIFLEGNVNVGANLTVRGNVNPINIVGTNTFLPLTVQSPSTFGTWLELNNTSTGGHNWAILSAGGGNSEGAGNLGITNFTGTSTIFLEGNVQTNSLNSTGNVTVGGNLDMGFSYVIGPTTAVSPGTEATTVAICPAGTKIMSGGFDITPGPNGAQVLSNVPGLVAQDRWVVRVFNNGGSSVSVNAEAVCARLVVAQCCF